MAIIPPTIGGLFIHFDKATSPGTGTDAYFVGMTKIIAVCGATGDTCTSRTISFWGSIDNISYFQIPPLPGSLSAQCPTPIVYEFDATRLTSFRISLDTVSGGTFSAKSVVT